MTTLRRVRVAPRDPRPLPPNAAHPPVPTRRGQAEPYPPTPDHAPPTTAHGPSFAARAVGWLDRLRQGNADRAEAAQRRQWARGFAGGGTAKRAEIQAELRSRLESGHYDYRTGNDAVRDILAYLDQETQ